MEWFDAIPMTKVADRLYLGNYYNATQLVKDNPNGITAILDVSAYDPYDHGDLKYHRVPFWDGETIPQDMFWACMMWLRDRYETGETILVHCVAGISRSPTITASFMYSHLGWNFDLALQWLQKARPVVNPAPLVKVSAKKYLKVWPYDGSMENPPKESFVWLDASGAAAMHPDPECPLRKFFLLAAKLGESDNTARHTIPCTCKR